jgi:membrane-associated phospholipid phosphatase
VFGGHYLVDLLAGSLVMVALVLLWHRPLRRGK